MSAKSSWKKEGEETHFNFHWCNYEWAHWPICQWYDEFLFWPPQCFFAHRKYEDEEDSEDEDTSKIMQEVAFTLFGDSYPVSFLCEPDNVSLYGYL